MGSLSAGVGIGKAGTGAICAPGPLFGRPMAQKGSSSCFGGLAGGVVVCWAMAGHTLQARPATTMISPTIRHIFEAPVMSILPWSAGPGVLMPLLPRSVAGAMLAPALHQVKT